MNSWIIGPLLLLRIFHLATSTSIEDSNKTSFQEDEVITIQNKTHILCVTSNKVAPIYVSPPANDAAVNPSTLLDNLAEIDGWQVKSLQDSVHEPVIDKRWEDYQVRYENYLEYEFKKSFTFSTYNLSSDIEIFAEDEDTMEYYTLPKNPSGSWSHFSLIEDNKVLTTKRDNKWIGTVTNFRPTKIVIRTKDKTHFKIHNYTYLYSDKPSTQLAEVSLSVDLSCLVVNVYMCPSCYLQFEHDKFSHKKSWQARQINIDPAQKKIHIFKGINSDNTENPYWKLDLRPCPKVENDLVLYETPVSEEFQKNMESQCFILDSRPQSMGNPYANNCSAGSLGKRCNINCKDLLGEQMNYCQQRKICENDNCFCAWGYKGSHCDEECSKGEWGINCQNRCNAKKCQVCDPFTGECVKDPIVHQFATNEKEGNLITLYFEKTGEKASLIDKTDEKVSSYKKNVFIGAVGITGALVLLMPGIIIYLKIFQKRKPGQHYITNININSKEKYLQEKDSSEEELINYPPLALNS